MLREARAIVKATDGTPPQQKMTVAENAQRARTVKARRTNARANEASPLVAKHAKEEPLNRGMLTLGNSAIAMLVKGCPEPFPVLPMRTILARLLEQQGSSMDHRALVSKLCRKNRQTVMSHKLSTNVVHITSTTPIYRLGSTCINLDHGAFRHCIQSLVLWSDLAPILFLEDASYDETPMTVCTTDYALDLKNVLQESAETSRAFTVSACGLVTTGSREVRDSDVGSAKLFQARSRIAQVLRTRPEAGQAAKFFVVAGHPLTHVQELVSALLRFCLRRFEICRVCPRRHANTHSK